MEVDRMPPVDRASARLRDEPGTPVVERQQRPPPVAPSREDRWERSDASPEDEAEAERRPPHAPEEEDEEGGEEAAGQAEGEDRPRHLDARA